MRSYHARNEMEDERRMMGDKPNDKQPLWDMEEEEVFDSRSGEILEQELIQMARKQELDFMEKFGVYESGTLRSASPRREGLQWARSGLM